MKQLEINIEELRKRKLFVGTPMYGGKCDGIYTNSMMQLVKAFDQYGIKLEYYQLMNESLISRARNYVSDVFLRSDCTHMLFIDSDIAFNPMDVIAMMYMMSDDSEYDIMCGPYPKKTIAWEKIVHAVNKGVADEDPTVLDKYVGDYVFNPVPIEGKTEYNLLEPMQVLEAGTGFMMIKRSTFDRFKEAYPQQSYKPDHARTDDFDGSREIVAYFDCPIDPETKRYLSEDYMFCQWSRKIGLKVWLCPWIQLKHQGSYIFGGSLLDIASIGAHATVDPELLKNTKKKK